VLGEYDGTVLLVSHDRDFIDRVATATVAMEGNGRASVYPGGWSDYAAQRGAGALEMPTKDRAGQPSVKPASRPALEGLSFSERKRLEFLPETIAKLEAEIARLAALLESDDLYSREPVKFRKASEALADRQKLLAAAEEEWLGLAERA